MRFVALALAVLAATPAGLAPTAAPAPEQAPDGSTAVSLTDLQVSTDGATDAVVFIASGEVECSLQRQENPSRLIVQFPRVRSRLQARTLPAGLQVLSGLRIEETVGAPPISTRAVLELRRPAQVDVGRAPGRITLILRSASTSQEEPAEVAEVIPLYLSVPDASDTGPPAAAKETAGSETPLGAQDLLHVEVLGVEALERRVRVGSDGTITLPLVGSLTAAGRTPAALGREIARLLADRFVKDPQVSVFVEEYRSRRVAVSGAVGRAGSFEIFRPTTLLEVLALCGGVLPEEAGPRVQIVRPSPDGKSRTFEIDRAALQAGDPQRNLLVAPGDLVHVPFEEMLEVLVQGRVVKPDRYRLRRSSAPTVLRAVLLAGGPAAGSAGRRVEVVRRESATRSRTLEVNLQRIREGKEPDLPLQTDDVIVVR